MTVIKNKRHAAFVARVVDGESYVDAWTGASRDTGATVGTSIQSIRVMGSRLAARYAVEIAHAKQARADARTQSAQPVTRESIHQLLEEVTGALMDASKAASRAGADGIAQQLHKNIVVHAGRSQRASAWAPSKPKIDAFDAGDALSRLKMCTCDA